MSDFIQHSTFTIQHYHKFTIFVSMKLISFFILLLTIVVLFACSGKSTQSMATALIENHMDFPEAEKKEYKNITFQLSPSFIKPVSSNYTLKKHAFTRIIYDLHLNFSIECFSESEAKKIQTKFSESTNKLNAIHDYYVRKRENSIYSSALSIKKDLPKVKGKEGLIQVIEGSTYKTSVTNSYFASTLKIGKEYYVFQLIGKRDNMGYLYDDFQSILASVKKK